MFLQTYLTQNAQIYEHFSRIMSQQLDRKGLRTRHYCQHVPHRLSLFRINLHFYS